MPAETDMDWAIDLAEEHRYYPAPAVIPCWCGCLCGTPAMTGPCGHHKGSPSE